MKLTTLILFMVAAMATTTATAQENYRFDHGPYLQGLTTDKVTVYFTTSAKGFSQIQLRSAGSPVVTDHVTVNDGLIEAYNTMNAITVNGLKANTVYEYRMVSKEMTEFKPYKITFGDSIASKWYSFSTLDTHAKSCSFVSMSDIHDDDAKYRKLLSLMPLDKAHMVLLNGDIMSYFDRPGQPYSSFIDASVEIFATEKPFMVVRGNHETRGNLARTYDQFVQRQGGHYYGLYTIGQTVIVMLDSGEDKPDDTSVYAGITAFDVYRERQAAWLADAVKSNEFRRAKRRIVMVHIPPTLHHDTDVPMKNVDYGAKQINDLFMPILNRSGIDLMICGHTHRHALVEKSEGVNNFPIVINDNQSASFVSSSPKGISVRTMNVNGETLLNRVFF